MPWGDVGHGRVSRKGSKGGWGSVGNTEIEPSSGGHHSGGHGFLHALKKYSGAELAENLGKDIGQTAVQVGPGLYHVGKAAVEDTKYHLTGGAFTHKDKRDGEHVLNEVAKPLLQQYRDYYGHDVLHHIYTHPLQAFLDAATVATGGSSAVAKVGKAVAPESRVAKLGERGEIITRSPRKIATGKGPSHVDITSTRPLVKLREQGAAKARSSKLALERRGGEVERYGKQIQAEATQQAHANLTPHDYYHQKTRKLSPDEWTALHVRALDVHPDDLAELWRGTPAEQALTEKAKQLALHPSKRMLDAEPAARVLSEEGAKLYKQRGKLTDETAEARPELTRRQASEVLGREARSITGHPYYFPHTLEPERSVSPLKASGGGKAVPAKLGSMKQSTGVLSLHGRLHLRGDVLGPDFLRRVKYVKYDEIHNALVRGAVRISGKEIVDRHGGKLPKGWEYVREKASTRIPPALRAEGDQRVPIDKLIPNPEDLHDSTLGEGFTTSDAAQAHQSGGNFYIIPTRTARAATGEFTRSSDFTRNFVKRPLQVWRALVLGLRVGFLTNNLVGNSLMYAVKTGGQGALRDLFGAIRESHGDEIARRILDDPATPPELRRDLYREHFPEQTRGTFGRTQTPATSAGHIAGRKALEAGRTVTGAIPKLTSKVAEEYPRRALIRHYIRHSPEFKKVYAGLPKQTRTFEEAARKTLEQQGKPYQRHISKLVNQALGDYLHLSPFERNVMRNALPFYAWYRAITTTTYHLAADTPGRAEALALISRIGNDPAAEGEVPSFLQGAIGLGEGANGTNRVLATQGLNPYATLNQLRRGATEDIGDLGLNPFLIGLGQTYAQLSDGGVSPGRLVGGTLYEMLRGLPPARVFAPKKPSRLYPNRGRKSELLGYLGAPVKEYRPAEAARQARLGR